MMESKVLDVFSYRFLFRSGKTLGFESLKMCFMYKEDIPD